MGGERRLDRRVVGGIHEGHVHARAGRRAFSSGSGWTRRRPASQTIRSPADRTEASVAWIAAMPAGERLGGLGAVELGDGRLERRTGRVRDP